ncbi:MAG: hypothetical protein IJX75_00965 [Clostridia bacterium]|nr:hypothetical protein [Clostridia bacterium]
MPYLYLVGAVLTMSSMNLLSGFFNRKNNEKKDPVALYNLIYILIVFAAWTIKFLLKPDFDAGVLWYSMAFGISFALATIGMTMGMKLGSVTLTSLMIQLSTIMATIWGFFFWNAKFTLLVALGLALVVVSMWLCLYKGKEADKGVPITWKWFIFAMMGFLGNAGCTIIQRSQQIAYSGKYGDMLMMFAMTVAVAIFVFQYVRSDKTDTSTMLKTSSWIPALSGLSNVAMNVFVMLLATAPISSSIVYPVIAVGGLATVSLFSLFVFKEKLFWWQWLGIVVGAVAVALLSL